MNNTKRQSLAGVAAQAPCITKLKQGLAVGLCVGSLLAPGGLLAGSQEVGAAKGLMIASILHEKCTGKQPLANETERQVRMLQDQGFSAQDIQKGFMEGMVYAESAYPGKKKPPQSECNSAIKLYQQSLKFM